MIDINFSKNKIIVMGDFILDYYRFLDADRLSPEAPVIVFRETDVQWRLGGAGNVANNLKAMGVGEVKLFTVVGDDFDGFGKDLSFVDKLHGSHFNGKVLSFVQPIISRNRVTTVKERIIARTQQILRVDSQSTYPVTVSDFNELVKKVEGDLEGTTAIVVSDYAHGVMQYSEMFAALISTARDSGIHVIVDTKSNDAMRMYHGASIIVPNLNEAKLICGSRMLGLTDRDTEWLAEYLRDEMDLEATAITLGHEGAVLSTKDGVSRFQSLDHGDEEVVDVTGAGDTLAAAMAAALGAGMSYDEAMKVAQAAAGVVVQKLGVSTAAKEEIKKALERYEEGDRHVEEGRGANEDHGKTGLVRGGEGQAGSGAPA
jgi:D-beta-D-heptose 7-phosphate kinase/D-beta-D-heptose 1-phosphate adenosyltransferase